MAEPYLRRTFLLPQKPGRSNLAIAASFSKIRNCVEVQLDLFNEEKGISLWEDWSTWNITFKEAYEESNSSILDMLRDLSLCCQEMHDSLLDLNKLPFKKKQFLGDTVNVLEARAEVFHEIGMVECNLYIANSSEKFEWLFDIPLKEDDSSSSLIVTEKEATSALLTIKEYADQLVSRLVIELGWDNDV